MIKSLDLKHSQYMIETTLDPNYKKTEGDTLEIFKNRLAWLMLDCEIMRGDCGNSSEKKRELNNSRINYWDQLTNVCDVPHDDVDEGVLHEGEEHEDRAPGHEHVNGLQQAASQRMEAWSSIKRAK